MEPLDELPASEVSIAVKGEYRYIKSNSIPNHTPGDFPNAGNPNAIRPQSLSFRVPLHPKPADEAQPLGRSLFGVTLNGVAFDPGTAEAWKNDPRSGWNIDAHAPKVDLGLDEHHAHVQPGGTYHYHGRPIGLIHLLQHDAEHDAGHAHDHGPGHSDEHSHDHGHNDAHDHSAHHAGDADAPGEAVAVAADHTHADTKAITLIGYAADGFPIYDQFGYVRATDPQSPVVKLRPSYRLKRGQRPAGDEGPGGRYDGTYVQDFEYVQNLGALDECNGRFGVTPEYPEGTYYYVTTDRYPFVPRFFRGTPDASFRKQGGPPGRRGPEGNRPPDDRRGGPKGRPGGGPEGGPQHGPPPGHRPPPRDNPGLF